MVRTLFGVLTVTFLLSIPLVHRMARSIDIPPDIHVLGGELGVASRFFAIDLVGPLWLSYLEFLLSRLTTELIAGVLVYGLAIALFLEAHERH